MHSFTTEDLLLYMYKETSPEITTAIKLALDSDWTLREKLDGLYSATLKLETISLAPRQQTIDNIMNYAERSIEELTPQA